MQKSYRLSPPQPVRRQGARGFSLVELIVVIVITGIIAATMGLFIAGPIQAFFDQARRGELVDAAQLAQLRMGRDLRGALPNSVRVNLAGDAIEMLYTLDGDRYRTEPPGTDLDRLEFTGADSSFNTLAPLAAPANPYTGYLAVYPLSQTLANPYVLTDRVMTGQASLTFSTVCMVAGTPPLCTGGYPESRVSMPAHQFRFDSPTKRVFLVEGPVSYRCAGGNLLRYSGYAVTDPQPVPPAVAPVVIVKNVESCAFTYAAGTAQRNAVVRVDLVLADGPAGQAERIRLLRQVQVDNSP